MDDNQAKQLGRVLRAAREERGWSTRGLAERSGVGQTNIVRLEIGFYTTPAPDKLAKIAEALGLKLADVYALADYAVPSELPSFAPYLRTKYRDIPAEDVEAIEKYAARLAKKHGVSLSGPAPGEDES